MSDVSFIDANAMRFAFIEEGEGRRRVVEKPTPRLSASGGSTPTSPSRCRRAEARAGARPR